MIEQKDIERLAELSRMKLPPEEMEEMRKDIDAILGYVSQIQEVAENLPTKPEAGLNHNVFRLDGEPHARGVYTETLLNEAPAREGKYIKVKKILAGGDVS